MGEESYGEKLINKLNNTFNGISQTPENAKERETLSNIQKCQEEKKNNKLEYLVRGAILTCTCGSHRRLLNLPKSHGVYIDNNPVMHNFDNVTEDVGRDICNITFFGVCSVIASFMPVGDMVVYKKTVENSADGNAGIVQGYKCIPMILNGWFKYYPNTIIVDPATGRKNFAITTQSFLSCIFGGTIQPVYSGQNTELIMSDVKNLDDYRSLTGKGEVNFNPFSDRIKQKESEEKISFPQFPTISKKSDVSFPNPFSKNDK